MIEPKSKGDDERPHWSPFQVRVSHRFIVLSLLSCILVAFAVGRTARVLLVINPQKKLLEDIARKNVGIEDHEHLVKLPNPVLKGGKLVPQTSYTSKNFDTARSASINSRWVVTEEGKDQCVDLPGNECAAPNLSSSIADSDSHAELEDEEPHLPQGQHLLIDIENVDSAFLNSEERLANAMLDLVNQCGLTLLSYHCHHLQPMGVSCAGVLLESHVSFHTWPSQGVITLDLFTCGPNSLLPIVPLAEKLFSIPSSVPKSPGQNVEQPRVVWAHKYRGFGDGNMQDTSELADFFNFPIGVMMDYKTEVWCHPRPLHACHTAI
jgi:S-adenosylmethionine decarboxylase proenzyme